MPRIPDRNKVENIIDSVVRLKVSSRASSKCTPSEPMRDPSLGKHIGSVFILWDFIHAAGFYRCRCAPLSACADTSPSNGEITSRRRLRETASRICLACRLYKKRGSRLPCSPIFVLEEQLEYEVNCVVNAVSCYNSRSADLSIESVSSGYPCAACKVGECYCRSICKC